MLDAIKASIKKIKMPSKADSLFTKDPKTRRPLELGPKDANILKKIATSNNESCTCKKLAKSLKMSANALDVHLRYLMGHKLVTKKNVKNGEPLYHTTKAGLSYLIRK